MIKLKGKEFSLWKKGPVNVQMVFSEGKKTMTDYFTPFGNILVAMDTKEVCVTENADCIKYILPTDLRQIINLLPIAI